MLELKLLNPQILELLAQLGHTDQLIVCDAGFPIPPGIKTIDISLTENLPTVLQTLEVLKDFFSVEQVTLAEECAAHNPDFFEAASHMFGRQVPIKIVSHSEFKKMSYGIKGVIRTGDFTAWSNVMLQSAGGGRWKKQIV